MLFHEYLLLSLFPFSYFIRVYFIISAFGVESIVYHSRSSLLLNRLGKDTVMWPPDPSLMKNLWSQLLGELWADRLQLPASSEIAQLLRVPCPRSCPFLGSPHSMSEQCKNIKSWPPWPNTKWHFSSRVPCGVS